MSKIDALERLQEVLATLPGLERDKGLVDFKRKPRPYEVPTIVQGDKVIIGKNKIIIRGDAKLGEYLTTLTLLVNNINAHISHKM